ncbi:MAG: magnesium chelatase subunit D [Gammaproteobacteria bacterium]|nr:magnesium chelatase subunit D [Gammaproteobacteria bacterium]
MLPAPGLVRRLPCTIGDERLLGGLDLTATLRSGRPVAERGVLAETDGGVIVIAMAERLPALTAARIVAAIDEGEVRIERDGVALRSPARLGVVALDEGESAEESAPAALLDRLAFRLDLRAFRAAEPLEPAHSSDQILQARGRLAAIDIPAETIAALAAAAEACACGSLRATLLCVRVARVAAALAGHSTVEGEDAELAARLVLGPRAEAHPSEPPDEEQTADSPPPTDRAGSAASAQGDDGPDAQEQPQPESGPGRETHSLEEVVLQAAAAAIPSDLLARARGAEGRGATRGTGAARRAVDSARGARGRRCAIRQAPPSRGLRLELVETLRAAVPWQGLRGRPAGGPLQVRPEDLRVGVRTRPRPSLIVFAVDASGSAALHRLAEAKGAVELLLAECYVRRDQVAVLGFRNATAELLLPPTRSLVRAKRSLAGLAGGGGTPLAAAIDKAWLLADQARRRGDTPTLVFLSDGRANIARDGTGSRERAQSEALAAAARVRATGTRALFIDISQRPDARARALANAMGASYSPLPQADARALRDAVRSVSPR